jgi:two-component system, OmpR family, sensor histidine kinase VicK
VAHEVLQQGELPAGQLEFSAPPRDPARQQIHLEVSNIQDRSLRLVGTAREGAHAGQQFFEIEGLGEVVVGAAVEGLDLVAHLATGGQHQDGEGRAPGADASEDRLPIHARQHDIQEDEVDVLVCGLDHAVGAVVGGDGLVTVGGEAALQKARYGRIVFHYEDTHRGGSIIQAFKNFQEAIMSWLRSVRGQPWRMIVVAVGGLLLFVLMAGLVGLVSNRSVANVTNDVLRYDVDLEDEGDDLRAAVLDMRHYHRNILFAGPTETNVDNYEDAYSRLQEEVTELERLGVREPSAPQPEDIRAMADDYYADFRPAVALYEEDKAAFDRASKEGLDRLDRMNRMAEELDEVGEQRWEEALTEVGGVTRTASMALLAIIFGLLLAGAVLAYTAVRFVNELRRLDAEQKATAEKLEAANRAKAEFIADVSHELRTPLTVLRGNAQVGLAQGAGDPETPRLFEEIVEESRRMSRMVEDLLLLAKSDSASLPYEFETVEVEPVLAELAGRAAVLARERGATLKTEIAGGGLARIDQEKLEQAVLILVDNAAKYGSENSSTQAEIVLSSLVRSGELRITVRDRGPGIPENELPRIFERFYRLDKARSRRMGGTGLGLPIAKTIIEAHNGHLEAVSRPGHGTTMSLYIPLLQTEAPAPPQSKRAHAL